MATSCWKPKAFTLILLITLAGVGRRSCCTAGVGLPAGAVTCRGWMRSAKPLQFVLDDL